MNKRHSTTTRALDAEAQASNRPGFLRAGVAKSDITFRGKGARIRDPLYAKVLVLDDGQTRVAIVAVDTTAIGGRKISARILNDGGEEFLPRLRRRVQRELKIPGRNVLVNASHTHPPGRLLCDDREQVERTFDAVRRAVRDLVPVKVGAGAGHEDRITINRDLRLKDGRHWTIRHSNPCPPDEEVAGVGPIDPEIGILRTDRLDGRPLAVVYNFACHPLFGDAQGVLTANFPGVASRVIEERLGPGALALFLQGAGGDIIDVLFKDFSRPRDVEPLGVMLGESTLKAWKRISTGGARLRVVSETVQLPRRTDIPARIGALEREQAELLESLRGTSLNFKSFLPLYLKHLMSPDCPSDDSYRYLHARKIGDTDRAAMDRLTRRLADKYLRNIQAMEKLVRIRENIDTLKKHQGINRASGSRTIPAEIQAIRIGDTAIITSPAELLVEVGLNLKKASPHQHTLVAAFSNGYLHYGPPAAAYDKGGYEVTECLLAPEWQRIFEKKAREIMRRL